MAEEESPAKRVGLWVGIIAGVLAIIAGIVFIYDLVRPAPTYPLIGSKTIVYDDSQPLEGSEWDDVRALRDFLTENESKHVELNVTLAGSPSFADADDPLDGVVFEGKHVTFYVGGTLGFRCGDDECPESSYIEPEPGVYTVAVGDRYIINGAAIAIVKTSRWRESVGDDGSGHVRLRGCFFNSGKAATRNEWLTEPFVLRPAPGKC